MESFFHHFVPPICANMCTKFHDHRISGSELRQAGGRRFSEAPSSTSSNEPLKSAAQIGLSSCFTAANWTLRIIKCMIQFKFTPVDD